MIRCVVFDLDGTLVLSNDIKREGFFAAVSTITDGAAHIKVLLANPPCDRYTIFRRFTDESGGNTDDLVQRYTDWCEEKIVACPERQGAKAIMSALRQSGISIYLNSATPIEPLRTIVLRRFGSDYFDGIYGGYGCKAKNLKAILDRQGMHPNEIAMVGDGIDDRDAAKTIGCHFFGVTDGTLAAEKSSDPLLKNLEDMWPLLQHEQ